MSIQAETYKSMSRVMIGLAWADGEVTPDEMNLLKDITFHLPEMSNYGWAELEIYWMTPIGAPEMKLLGHDLVERLANLEARAAAKNMAEAIIRGDGTITDEEVSILREVEKHIDRADERVIDALGKLLQSALPKRAAALGNAPNRQDYLAGFIRNQVFDRLKTRFGDNLEHTLGLDTSELRRLGLAGALMGRVAFADYDIDDKEIQIMEEVLQHNWSLHPQHAVIATEAAIDAAHQALDSIRLTREFYEMTDYQERVDFLDILFDIAHAHNGISSEEVTVIERLAAQLKLDRSDFNLAHDRAIQREALAKSV